MKLKTRLMVSFLIIILFPLVLAVCALFGFYRLQMRSMQQTYGLEEDETSTYMSNSIQLLNRHTKSNYDKLKSDAQKNASLLENEEYLNTENELLLEKNSFLVVVKEGEVIYSGYQSEDDAEKEKLEAQLEGDMEGDTGSDVGFFLDDRMKVLIKQIDFTFEDGEDGKAFIVTDTAAELPEMKEIFVDIAIAIILILILTAAILAVWLYRGIIIPIMKLQVATQNIMKGNLDFTIEADDNDEIGELCQNFEKMRQRLKESTEDSLAYERENKVLISNISHDLKTPITAIKGYVEGIMDGVADTPEKVDKYIRTIYNKASEIDMLINELTLYSQIDMNRIPYNFNKINVAEYFSDCIDELGLDMESRNVGLNYHNYTTVDTVIIADPEQLKRVINNIIGNSLKYMDKEFSYIDIRIRDVGDFIQVEIEDNGRGIAANDLPHIFDRFYRADASRNSRKGGSGIGLSIVKKIIEDHGGQIWANSDEGVGTVMFFVIRKYQEVPYEQNLNY